MNQNQPNVQTPPNNPNQFAGFQQPNAAFQQQIKLPNSGGILTLGILSIVLAGGIGIILAIIALAMSGGAMNTYRANPQMYTESSMKKVKAGRTCAIIGLCLVGLVIILVAAANA
jgi:hypothetical protein